MLQFDYGDGTQFDAFFFFFFIYLFLVVQWMKMVVAAAAAVAVARAPHFVASMSAYTSHEIQQGELKSDKNQRFMSTSKIKSGAHTAQIESHTVTGTHARRQANTGDTQHTQQR